MSSRKKLRAGSRRRAAKSGADGELALARSTKQSAESNGAGVWQHEKLILIPAAVGAASRATRKFIHFFYCMFMRAQGMQQGIWVLLQVHYLISNIYRSLVLAFFASPIHINACLGPPLQSKTYFLKRALRSRLYSIAVSFFFPFCG